MKRNLRSDASLKRARLASEIDRVLQSSACLVVGLEAAHAAARLDFVQRARGRCDCSVLRNMIAAQDITALHDAAAATGRRLEPSTVWRRPPKVCAALADSWFDVVYSPEHVALFLHRGRTMPQALIDKIVAAMLQAYSAIQPLASTSIEAPVDASTLRVRCVELHTYAVGGSLATPLHRDTGSTLTLTILLTDAGAFDGGTFVTWSEGEPVCHGALARGDGVLIDSEALHNVTPVTRGVRQSLVCELWAGNTNCHDRFT